MERRLLALAMAAAIALTLAPWAAGPAAAASTVYVTENIANVRSGPSTSAGVVMRVYAGDPIVVAGTVSGQAVDGSSQWYRTRSGYYIAAAVVSSSQPTASPAAGGSRAGRWIDVNLSTFRARAMQGDQAVYTAKIVTGRPGWGTPVGTFRIQRRAPSVTMNSATIGIPLGTPGSYLLPNVAWTQYFTQYGHAIHGNYWVPASAFGNSRTSRGCVGMTNADAKVFYDFASIGTPVVIHY